MKLFFVSSFRRYIILPVFSYAIYTLLIIYIFYIYIYILLHDVTNLTVACPEILWNRFNLGKKLRNLNGFEFHLFSAGEKKTTQSSLGGRRSRARDQYSRYPNNHRRILPTRRNDVKVYFTKNKNSPVSLYLF